MLEEIRKEVREWSKKILEEPRESLGDWPVCPFAKGAWEANAVGIDVVDDWRDVIKGIHDFIENKSAITILVKMEPDDWDMDEFQEDVRKLNKRWSKKNVYTLGLHPWDERTFLAQSTEEDPELGLHDEYVFVLLFRLDELNIASKSVEEDGFYKQWTPELYYEVLARRKLGEGKNNAN